MTTCKDDDGMLRYLALCWGFAWIAIVLGVAMLATACNPTAIECKDGLCFCSSTGLLCSHPGFASCMECGR